MKQEALLYFSDTWLTLIGLVIFFSFFICMLLKVYLIKKDYFEVMSKMPLEETRDESR